MQIENYDLLEDTLVDSLEHIPGLSKRVFPIVDIQYETGPLAVYVCARDSYIQALDGPVGFLGAEYTVYLLDNTYSKMKLLARQAAVALRSLQNFKTDKLWIEQVNVEQTSPDIEDITVNLFRRTLTVTLDYQICKGEQDES